MTYCGHQYYDESGQGQPLVLLHGHTLDHRMWAPVIAHLAPYYRLVMPDLSGHGQSGASDTSYASDIAALLDHLGLDGAFICGLSQGGAAAISFAIHYPSRCQALIPVDAALFGHRFDQWPGPRPFIAKAQGEGLAPALEAWLADPLFAPALASPAGDQVRAMVRSYPGAAWLGNPGKPVPPGRPEAERLGEVTAPTLVMIGEHDLPDFQQIADRLAREIPNASRVLISGAGHLSPIERPEAFAQALHSFLRGQT